MSSVAVITARGGSKRIPRKNIRDFCGRPIISYSIEAAIKSASFDEVMVSTDDKEIAEIAKSYGAKVPFLRSESTSNDFATTDDVLREVVTLYKERGQNFEYMSCIYPTAPFVTGEKLKRGMDILIQNHADIVIAVSKFRYPPQEGFCIRDGFLKRVDAADAYDEDGCCIPFFHDVGQFYCYHVENFMNKAVMDRIMYPCIIPETESQDIDTESDWRIAELKYQILLKEGQNERG